MQNYVLILVSLIILAGCDEQALTDTLCETQEEQHLLQLKENQEIEDAEAEQGCIVADDTEDNDSVSEDEVVDGPVEDPEDEVEDEIGETLTFTVNYVLRDFSAQQAQKMDEAIEKLVAIVNSEKFKQRVLNHTYNGVLTFVDNEGLTNREIYERLMQGSETLNPAIDSEMDIDITLYYSNNSTVGYTYPNSERIWVNDKFFRSNSLGRVAANVIHEWTHKLGFDHDFNRTTRRNYSVPYGIGTIVRQLIDEGI